MIHDSGDIQELRRRLEETEETLRAIRSGEVDALVVDGPQGPRIYTLQGADHTYRMMIEAMQQGAASLSPDGKVLYCNRSLAEMIGIPHEKLVGSPIEDFIPESQRAFFAATLQQSHSRNARGEFLLRMQDGTFRPVLLALNPLLFAETAVVCLIVTDLTEQKRHQDLLAANRSKDLFLATLSHEMRTPLNAIVGWVAILRQNGRSDEDLREGLEVIDRNARLQTQLIEDILDVSRIVSGKLRLDIRPNDPREIVRAAVSVVRPAADARGVHIEVDLDRSLEQLSCDAARVQQVVWNLLSNAVKFTPAGGTITATLARERSAARIQVVDSGVGINADFLPYVFDRFRQADSSTRRKLGGLGLGLSIVKELVEMHGGSVDVQSAGEGRGSTFTVYLPLGPRARVEPDGKLDGAHRSENGHHGATSVVRLDGLRIVAVDDEPDARRLLTKLLQDAGASVSAAGSAPEALDAIDRFEPHLLLSDIAMPDQDGYDLIREVRARGYSVKALPAVALTAFAGKSHSKSALLAGFQVHVPKPIDPHELITVVGSLAGRTG